MEEHSTSHNKKEKIIRDYNKTAHFYDKRYRRIQGEKYEIVLNNYRVNGSHILDLGCGTGLFFEYIIKVLLHKEEIKFNYVGVDISWNMLLEFKSKIINTNYRNYNPNLILGDIDCLPFRENIFVSVFALTSFQNLPHTKGAIKESFRVSKNNGMFKLSILKKKLDLDSLLKIFNTKISDLIITKNDNLEDVVIQGIVLKE